MPGFMPGIHVFTPSKEDMDGRDKPGHDEEESSPARGEKAPPVIRHPEVAAKGAIAQARWGLEAALEGRRHQVGNSRLGWFAVCRSHPRMAGN
jgi:hypothetical protein